MAPDTARIPVTTSVVLEISGAHGYSCASNLFKVDMARLFSFPLATVLVTSCKCINLGAGHHKIGTMLKPPPLRSLKIPDAPKPPFHLPPAMFYLTCVSLVNTLLVLAFSLLDYGVLSFMG